MPILFTGEVELTIDAKQRLAIPSKHRAKVEGEGGSWFCVSVEPGIIRLYPAGFFQSIAADPDATLTQDGASEEFDRTFFPGVEEAEMDSAGRITLPRSVLEDAGLQAGDEVVLTGVRHRLEVVEKSAWRASAADRRAKRLAHMRSMESRPRRGDSPRGS